MFALQIEQLFLPVRMGQDLQRDPFCNLGSVDTAGVGEGDLFGFPDRGGGESVYACAEHVDEVEVGYEGEVWR